MTVKPPVGEIRQWWCPTCGRQLSERHQRHVRAGGPLGAECPGLLMELTYQLTIARKLD